MEEKEQGKKKDLGELIDQQGGMSALRRRTGLSVITIRKVRRGERVPFVGTAARMAEGLGVDVLEIDWPRGYATAPGQRPKVSSLDGLYEDEALRSEIEALIEREVQKRTATQTAAQTQGTESK